VKQFSSKNIPSFCPQLSEFLALIKFSTDPVILDLKHQLARELEKKN
jgi:hypothetical protein